MAIEGDYIGLLYQIFKHHITQFYDKIIPFPDWTGAKRNYWIHFMSAGVFEIWGNKIIAYPYANKAKATQPLTGNELLLLFMKVPIWGYHDKLD
ncbi:hypothetical protein [Paenibacillus monticola]|uniref:Uncharacterized protein n=1 Tax=Paenibacillus monticola TaxID=2666075 RepID=A0A7X2H0U0_9BACL|nr:hypothetical protein [Paenibacillus monticola]MRN51482.1 hypothetical protein [Paenibacillus monticola]